MVDTSRLKGVIASKNLSQRKVARMLGVAEKTFYSKMKRGIFDSDEISYLIKILDINNPLEIFFASIGTSHAPLAGNDDQKYT